MHGPTDFRTLYIRWPTYRDAKTRCARPHPEPEARVRFPELQPAQPHDRHRKRGSAEERRHRAIEALKMVGLESRMNHLPNQLSGGQQQRVAIARALVNDPVIILADEATGNLDTRTSYEIMMIFQELHSQGKTIAFVTHEPDIATFSGRTITLRDGLLKKDVINENVQNAKVAFEMLPPPETFEDDDEGEVE